MITEKIHDFLIDQGPATVERIVEAIPGLIEAGGAERALLLMRLDPAVERTNRDMWAARSNATTDAHRARKSAENFLSGRPGAPLASVVRAVVSDTGLAEHQILDFLAAQFVVVGTNIFNRRK